MSRCSEWFGRGAIATVLIGAAALSACSDIYYDRRETIALGADDAVATNKVVQMIDPWPPASGDRYIPGNGERVAGAVERYRNNRVTPPVGNGTSSAGYGAQQAPAAPPPPAVK